jgi:hypothetical protein
MPLEELVDLCQRLDQRHRANLAIKKGRYNPSDHPRQPALPAPRAVQVPLAAAYGPPGDPMDLSAANLRPRPTGRLPALVNGRIDEAERRRRVEQDLCRYCASPNHQIRDCNVRPSTWTTVPRQPIRPPLRVAAATTEPKAGATPSGATASGTPQGKA